MAKSTGRGPAMDPAFEAANNAYQALKSVKGDKLEMAVAMLSQRLGVRSALAEVAVAADRKVALDRKVPVDSRTDLLVDSETMGAGSGARMTQRPDIQGHDKGHRACYGLRLLHDQPSGEACG